MVDGPVLLLARGPGLQGRVFPLRGARMIIGRAVGADVFINDMSLDLEHAHVLSRPEGWVVVDTSAERSIFVNGTPVETLVLEDGDTFQVGKVWFRFHKELPSAIRHVVIKDRWVLFSPWREFPAMAYALARDGSSDVVRTSISKLKSIHDPWTRPLANVVEVVEETRPLLILNEIAGVSLADIVTRTLAQGGAQLDPRIAFAAARAACAVVDEKGADARLLRGLLFTWRGDLVWLQRAPSPHVRFPWLRSVAEDVLLACGCPGPSKWRVEDTWHQGLAGQLEQLDELSIDEAARRSLFALGQAAIAGGNVRLALDRAVEELGAPSAEEVQGLLAHLFADELALHERVLEDAGVLGVKGVLALPR